MDNIEQVCESMVGLSVEIRGVDCGRIMRWVCVEKDGKTFYVFVFSSGKKIEATGVIHYVRNRVHYPSGSEYVLAQRKIKPKFGGRPAFPNTISNRTNLRGAVMPRSLPHERELNSKLKNRKDK